MLSWLTGRNKTPSRYDPVRLRRLLQAAAQGDLAGFKKLYSGYPEDFFFADEKLADGANVLLLCLSSTSPDLAAFGLACLAKAPGQPLQYAPTGAQPPPTAATAAPAPAAASDPLVEMGSTLALPASPERSRLEALYKAALRAAHPPAAATALPTVVPTLDSYLPSLVDQQGATCLHRAAARGDGACTELMGQLEAHLGPAARALLANRPTALEGWTPFHAAAARGHTGALRRLLEWGAQPDAPGKQGHTALQIGSCNGHEAVVELLLGLGAPAGPSGTSGAEAAGPPAVGGTGPLDLAAHDGGSLRTGLFLAAMNGHGGIVGRLLGCPASHPGRVGLLERADVSGYTPLHAACLGGHPAIVEALLAAGADINRQARDHETPLHVAMRRNSGPVVAALARWRPPAPMAGPAPQLDVAIRNTFGSTVLHEGSRRASVEALEALRDNVPDRSRLGGLLWQRDNDGLTPLHEVGHAFHDPKVPPERALATLRLLLDLARATAAAAAAQPTGAEGAKAEAEAEDGDGTEDPVTSFVEWVRGRDYGDGTGLHYLGCTVATEGDQGPPAGPRLAGLLQAAGLLLEAGADPLAANAQGWTPLHYCTQPRLAPDPAAFFAAIDAPAPPQVRCPLAPHGPKSSWPVSWLAELGTLVDPLRALQDGPGEPEPAHVAFFRLLWAHVPAAPAAAAPGATAPPAGAAAAKAAGLGFDPHRERNLDNDTYLARRGPQNRIAPRLRWGLLGGDLTIRGIAAYIASRTASANPLPAAGPEGKQAPPPLRVVVLAGAGISTGAGIPDFRSPGTGLYTGATVGSRILRGAFDAGFLAQRPDVFGAAVRQLFLPLAQGRYPPTRAHRFLGRLAARGLLLRCYSQNIDGLERRGGVPEERLVESHGTMTSARCTNPTCPRSAQGSFRGADMDRHFWEPVSRAPELAVFEAEVEAAAAAAAAEPPAAAAPAPAPAEGSAAKRRGHPVFGEPAPARAPEGPNPLDLLLRGRPGPDAVYARCPDCGHPLRPDVVYFGEPLPTRFNELSGADMAQCDLLIVAGTSLLVYPFAGLVNQVPLMCPRVLFNNTPAGPFKGLMDSTARMITRTKDTITAPQGTRAWYEQKLAANEGVFRDVLSLGDIDEGIAVLEQYLGWADEQ
ncbi:putative NAD-dependent protein deacetylase sirtuin-2 [Paratrimastix pyriformis]|uniref:NAD-dependent protein deacetylase sirtuin-2 n=1 Tax=Paratrimastix pyriformis TaxID=342808 RepID=A0ABQ8UDP1_9EUKA|nr:putative NAD-dependent protein deacetylase sirtuin-2 [Paratrimastix pyriformis]